MGPTQGSGVTSRDVLARLIDTASKQYASVLPSNLTKKQREMSVAGFKDGMRTLADHLVYMEVIAIVQT